LNYPLTFLEKKMPWPTPSAIAFQLALNYETNGLPNTASSIFVSKCDDCGCLTHLCVDNPPGQSNVERKIKHSIEICCGAGKTFAQHGCDRIVDYCFDCLIQNVPGIVDTEGTWTCEECFEDTVLSYQNINWQLLPEKVYALRDARDEERARAFHFRGT
jgi:hypothetical protein